MTKDKAMKLALEALELINIEFVCGNGSHHKKEDRHEWDEDCPITNRWRKAIIAIKEALAQPEQIQPSADSNTHQPKRHELQAKKEHPAPCARHCEANAFKIVIRNLKAQLAQPNEFNPDWDAMAVMVEEQQRMAKRIAELERENFAWRTKLGVRGYELQIEDLKAQSQTQPCAGRNCGSTNPNLHSAECFEDYERSTGMAQPEQPSVPWSAALESVWGEPEQEPVIGKWSSREVYFDEDGEPISHRSPPQRKPLTDEEIDKLLGPFPRYADEWSMTDFIRFARAIEAAHGIKE